LLNIDHAICCIRKFSAFVCEWFTFAPYPIDIVPEKNKIQPTEKQNLHPRNKHRARYNFDALIKRCSGLKGYMILNEYEDRTIDFADPGAVKTLNKALLMYFYGVTHWDIPEGYLCPPVPGRADYIHYLADLLAENNNGIIPKQVSALDIGIGANCIYPIIGRNEYGWTFVGSDVDPIAIKSAAEIITANKLLKSSVKLRLQPKPENIFTNIIKPGELFDATICNPPFHSSSQEAEQVALRKLNNLSRGLQHKTVLNFGGQQAELWCRGGEQEFLRRMVEQSTLFAKQSLWFTTLVAKKDNLPGVYHHLRRTGALDVRTINMAQGQKVSRLVAWTFLTVEEQKEWSLKRWQ
jgi:23S rRNA (adenine1618-N6)-methyltransferase